MEELEKSEVNVEEAIKILIALVEEQEQVRIEYEIVEKNEKRTE